MSLIAKIYFRVDRAVVLLKWWKINLIHQENIQTLIVPELLFGLERWTVVQQARGRTNAVLVLYYLFTSAITFKIRLYD